MPSLVRLCLVDIPGALLISEGKLMRRNESAGERGHGVERVRIGKCPLDVLKTKNKKEYA